MATRQLTSLSCKYKMGLKKFDTFSLHNRGRKKREKNIDIKPPAVTATQVDAVLL